MGHRYTYQIIDSLKLRKPKNKDDFCLEGIAQYIMTKTHPTEFMPLEKCKPKSKKDAHLQDCLYEYSPQILKEFIDENGLDNSIKKIFSHSPIRKREILNIEKYFKRISK